MPKPEGWSELIYSAVVKDAAGEVRHDKKTDGTIIDRLLYIIEN